MRRGLCLLVWGALAVASARADGGADAVAALSQLTDPGRLATLSDGAFSAQLGPALGWLHVARRRDISPEAIIARAFAANGLDPARAGLTRACLLRNLARADDWQLFQFAGSAQALALGRPAVIPVGMHRGRLAQADLRPTGAPRQFSDLVLRADDEPPLRPPPRAPTRTLRPDERLAPRSASRRRPRIARLDPIPTEYDDALPAR